MYKPNLSQWDIFISASWKQRGRVRVLANQLRNRGFSVYDFTDSRCRRTPEIPPEAFPEEFDPKIHDYAGHLARLSSLRAAVDENREALDNCRLVALLLPCGLDSQADWAYAVGAGKRSVVVGHPPAGERSPDHLWADAIVPDEAALFAWLVEHLPVAAAGLHARRAPQGGPGA